MKSILLLILSFLAFSSAAESLCQIRVFNSEYTVVTRGLWNTNIVEGVIMNYDAGRKLVVQRENPAGLGGWYQTLDVAVVKNEEVAAGNYPEKYEASSYGSVGPLATVDYDVMAISTNTPKTISAGMQFEGEWIYVECLLNQYTKLNLPKKVSDK